MTNEAHTLALNAAHSYRNIDPEHLDEQDAWVSLIKAIDALATMSSPAAKVGTEDTDAQAKWGYARTVGNAIAQLKTFDSATPFFAAFHIENHAVARGATFSREKVVDERWIGERYQAGKWVTVPRDEVPYSIVVWSQPEAMAPAAPESFYIRFAKEWITASGDDRQCISEFVAGWYDGDEAPAAPVAAVGEAVARVLHDGEQETVDVGFIDWVGGKVLKQGTLLYAAPQPRSSPLTESRLLEIYNEHFPESWMGSLSLNAFARAIETAHGILPAASMGAK